MQKLSRNERRVELEESSDIERSLFFTCGHVVSRDAIVIPAQYNAFPDENISRVALKFGDRWGYHDVYNDVISSVTFQVKDNSLWLLGMHGVIRTVGGGGKAFTAENVKGQFREEMINSGPYGELLCVKAIGDNVYACGQSSQVYIRKSGGWDHMDQGMLEMAAPALESMDGTGPNNIYAVGEKGTILHYNGKQWIKLDSPTNRPLSTIRYAQNNEFYICGNDGMLFRGNKDKWDFIGDPDVSHNFWGLEVFRDNVYVAHINGLMRHTGSELKAVGFGLKEDISCHKLHANDGVLWSFGTDDLLFYDGTRWTRVICPENV